MKRARGDAAGEAPVAKHSQAPAAAGTTTSGSPPSGAVQEAVRTYGLLQPALRQLVPERDPIWQRYLATRSQTQVAHAKALADGLRLHKEECLPHCGSLLDLVRDCLDGIGALSSKERALLLGCVAYRRNCYIQDDGCGGIRSFDSLARIHSVDGPGCVDLFNEYHHRPLWDSIEHIAHVRYAVRGRATAPLAQPRPPRSSIEGERPPWACMWHVFVDDVRRPGSFTWDREHRTLELDQSTVVKLRRVLFNGPAGAALGAKISDAQLLCVLLAAVGVCVEQPEEETMLSGMHHSMKYMNDGWEAAVVRVASGEAKAGDAKMACSGVEFVDSDAEKDLRCSDEEDDEEDDYFGSGGELLESFRLLRRDELDKIGELIQMKRERKASLA